MDGFRFVAKVRTLIHYRSLQTGNVSCRKNIWKSWGARDFDRRVGSGVARSVRIDHPLRENASRSPARASPGDGSGGDLFEPRLEQIPLPRPVAPAFALRCGLVDSSLHQAQRRSFDGSIRLGSRRREQPASRRPVPEAAHPTRPLFVHSHRVREQGGREVCPPGPPR
jgi:hypothetical protein